MESQGLGCLGLGAEVQTETSKFWNPILYTYTYIYTHIFGAPYDVPIYIYMHICVCVHGYDARISN